MAERGSVVYALWPLRLGLALVFIVEGWGKLADLGATRELMVYFGIPLPAVAGFLVAVAEAFGGLGILLGVLPRFSAAVLAVVMAVAILVARIPGPFFDGWAFDAVLLAGCLTVVLNGAGRPTLASVVREWRTDRRAALPTAAWADAEP